MSDTNLKTLLDELRRASVQTAQALGIGGDAAEKFCIAWVHGAIYMCGHQKMLTHGMIATLLAKLNMDTEGFFDPDYQENLAEEIRESAEAIEEMLAEAKARLQAESGSSVH